VRVSVPAAGTVIGGKYRVVRTVGVGGMAVVLEVRHLRLGQRMAIKMLRDDTASVPARLARFNREARIAAQLTSEHVTRVLDIGETAQGEPFLVMELLHGHDLSAELTTRGPLPISEAVDIVLEACEAIAEAHAAGLVHRDVKPGNLFLAERPLGRGTMIKVLDFGLSKVDDGDGGLSLTRTGAAFGTPNYMSPEQVLSTKHVDARTDQHALAAVLFELVTGAPPYRGNTSGQIAVAVAEQPPPRLREVLPGAPAGLERVICRALAKLPDGRYPDIASFARALSPFGGPRAAELCAAASLALERRRRIAGGSGTEDEAHSQAEPAQARSGLPVVDFSDEPESESITELLDAPGRLPRIEDSEIEYESTRRYQPPVRDAGRNALEVVKKPTVAARHRSRREPQSAAVVRRRAKASIVSRRAMVAIALVLVSCAFAAVTTWYLGSHPSP
jgi:serine/threonine-protein kinase